MQTAREQTEKLWLVAKRMEPHLARKQAQMDKLLNMLLVYGLVSRGGENVQNAAPLREAEQEDRVDQLQLSEEEREQLWNELCSRESYEAKVAQAIIRMSDQIKW
ncbi:hypothetical protein [Brevibacillus sp. SAFN-007a]|uniref:hypothetical protein n=1 Tax=Brevibacillus sp. SAFN-007a TaxID=3436862 RepID=UPI003F7E41EC